MKYIPYNQSFTHTGCGSVKIAEKKNGYLFNLEIDLAGNKKSDIDITFNKNVYYYGKAVSSLDIAGKTVGREKSYTLYLTRVVNQEDISSKFEDGILYIDIKTPKEEEEIKQKIFVK